MELGLNGKVALITGVSQGIGLACATSLLSEGARVLGTSRSAPPPLDGLTHLPLDMTEPAANALSPRRSNNWELWTSW